MTKRYYYDCAIEAAYMAKNFGMVLTDSNGESLMYHGDVDFSPSNISLQSTLYRGSIHHIAPDSLPLLKPKCGDVVQLKDNYVGRVDDYGDVETAGDRVIGNVDIKCPDMNSYRWGITQRDGKPFIWPKEQQAGEL